MIDTKLRELAIDKHIKIRLLVSHWKHTTPAMQPFLKSLADISNVYPGVDVQVVSYFYPTMTMSAVFNDASVNTQRVFIVPAFTPDQEQIPFSRVNHNKYMVTDQAAYIGNLA